MKFIIDFVKNIVKREQIKPLGRWNIDYCSKKMDKKIDLSNEDHCGPCGQYIISTPLYIQNTSLGEEQGDADCRLKMCNGVKRKNKDLKSII